MLLIVTQLFLNVEQDDAATSHADGEAENIDEGIRFEFEQISGGGFEVVGEH
jgi:hypothetical protein